MNTTETQKNKALEKQPVWKRKHLLTRLIFILIAALFWFVTKLSRDGYTDDFVYTVHWVTESKENVVTYASSEEFTLKIRGGGYALFRSNLDLDKELTMVAENSDKVTADGYEWNTRFNIDYVAEQIPEDLEIVDISPNRVKIRLDQLDSKMVEVLPRIENKLSPPHRIYGTPSLKNEKVKITAPGKVLDTLERIYTEMVSIETTNPHQVKEVKVDVASLENVFSDPEYLQLNVEVRQFTEKIVEVPIELRNVPSKGSVKLFPSSVNVRVNLAQEDYDLITEKDFVCYADFRNFNPEDNRIALNLETTEEKIEVVDWNDKSVEYLIIQ